MIQFIFLKTQLAIRESGGIQQVDQMLERNPDLWFAVDNEGSPLISPKPEMLKDIIFFTRQKIESYQSLQRQIEAFVGQLPQKKKDEYVSLFKKA